MTITDIKKLVCADYGVTMLDLLSKRRDRRAVEPRHVAMWLARHCTLHTLPAIGREFGRDHTTVMNAIERIDARFAADSLFSFRVSRLQWAVKAWDNEHTTPALRAVS